MNLGARRPTTGGFELMKSSRRLALAFTLLTICAVQGKADQKAFSVPVSKKIVRLEVQVPDGHWIKAAVLEGDQLRIEDHSLKEIVALIPIIKSGNLVVRVFRIEKHEAGEESMHFVEDIEQGFGETSYTKKTTATFSVRSIGTNEPSRDSNGRPATKNSCKDEGNASFLTKVGGGRCCVTCGATTSCGCAVDDTCGSCCSGGCCLI